MSASYLGIDIERATVLARTMGSWQTDAEGIVALIVEAETLADLPTGATLVLDQIGSDGRVMAAAITTAVAAAQGFRIDEIPVTSPRLSVFLDLPVGSAYDPDLAAEAIANGETYRQAQIAREINAILRLAPSQQRWGHADVVASLRAEYNAIDPLNSGDLGGTWSTEVRDPFVSAGASGFEGGLGIVTHALADTGDESQIRVDEFQAIFHDNGKLTLVLPGVIDLSSPHFGYDPTSRSARDFDQEAIGSSLSSKVDNNRYALLVFQWVKQQVDSGAIARGTEVLMVGHSFGADTALDLASDPLFNGELVNVTHVVPAAYHSEPQLPHVINGSQVGVLQNVYDLAVIAEGVADEILDGDLLGASSGVGRVGVEGVEEGLGWGSSLVNLGGWFVEESIGLAGDGVELLGDGLGVDVDIDLDVEIPNLPTDIELIEHRITIVDGIGFVAEFEGGFEGFGHHQNNYIGYLEEPGLNDVVTGFMTRLGDAGYGAAGASIAVDISVPGAVRASPAPPYPPTGTTRPPTPVPGPGPVPSAATVPLISPPVVQPPPPIPALPTPRPTPTPWPLGSTPSITTPSGPAPIPVPGPGPAPTVPS